MIGILDRYISNRIILATGLVLAVLTALMAFFVFVDAISDYGKSNFGLYQLARYVVLSQPRRLYEIFPVATLIGALLGLSALAVNAELVAMRAAGISVTGIVRSAMKVGLVFAVIATVMGEYVVPYAESQAQLGRAQALAQAIQQGKSGLWLRDGASFVNIGEVLPDLTLLNVNIYSFQNEIQLRSQIQAERAVYDNGEWRLQNVRRSEIEPKRISAHTAESEPWKTGLTQDVIGVFAVKPEGLSMLHLTRYIEHLRHNGQSTERYRLALWQKALMPLAVMVMVLLATPFALGHTRAGRLSQNIFIGVMLGLAFIVISRIFGHFGLLYGIPPFFGAALPIVLFFFGALGLLRRAV